MRHGDGCGRFLGICALGLGLGPWYPNVVTAGAGARAAGGPSGNGRKQQAGSEEQVFLNGKK